MNKKIGVIGLGRMGSGIAQRLLKNGIKVVAYNRSHEKIDKIKKYGAIPAYSLKQLINNLSQNKRIIWLMLPSGAPTNEMINNLLPLLKRSDIIINGANDFYENAEKHSKLCEKYKVYFFDCGVSGGILGIKNRYTLMLGGPQNQFKYIKLICEALAPNNGYALFGPSGSGHFVKSVHNIIEYVYLQGIGEGIELLSRFKHPIDIKKALSVWKSSSVIKSWLLDLAIKAIQRPDFKNIKAEINSVTINELIQTKNSVKANAPAFDASVRIRKDKDNKFSLGKKTIAAIRREFGGHAVKK